MTQRRITNLNSIPKFFKSLTLLRDSKSSVCFLRGASFIVALYRQESYRCPSSLHSDKYYCNTNMGSFHVLAQELYIRLLMVRTTVKVTSAV